ncbi:MAG: cytidine deaminase [Pseudomonadota bacterium]|uniref:cytidine deaminase n=1 Tax=Gallaecimonas pentaromativorans TaxID=584787 RepID=UPI00067F0BFC|nr:cytidine deaminase [Gallaecimonas pentaromativorans]MED5525788.1 cytidine deaminase [Pseudomonadota bacterium]
MNKSLLAASLPLLPSAIEKQAAAWLSQTPFIAQLPPAEVANWCALTHLSKDELMLALLPLARCFANAPISEFYVGAIAEGASGTWYFGANQEYSPAPLGMTVHAEQCVITHARQSGEQQITTLAVNYSPCGHCRQFMSEMSEALDLRVLLPGRPARLLADYLPDAFGPWDLDKSERLLKPAPTAFTQHSPEPLIQAAIDAASASHAPYTRTGAGVALEVAGCIVTGSYLENAAYNPSLPPLQAALVMLAVQGLPLSAERLVLAEQQGKVSLLASTQALAEALGLPAPEYIAL